MDFKTTLEDRMCEISEGKLCLLLHEALSLA